MRVLVDRHHADLFWSLQRLFEDRLGCQVYTPVGHEWWHEGIWRFGECFGDDRLAQQYLVVDAKYEPVGGHGLHRTFDPAHPRRPIFCAELDFARRLAGWAFVVATVQENQPGFARFAREVGARLVVQVGNTGQRIEWDLDPLVISSSEMPLVGRGVVAHQEIDSGPGGAYAFADPGRADRRLVRSFVNAMNRLPGWQAIQRAREELPDHRITIHGHEGSDGNLHPVEAIGAAMASAGWGWHDKPVGDGFGHVIHGWAAVGRPLIGHASYYRGKLAEPFWEDLVTCVDLDVRPLDEALTLVREISDDAGRHAGMCRAIRGRFDAAVDYDRDEARVRDLLGL